MLRKSGALLAAATFISALAVTEAGTAQAVPADPGFCGVRHSGPNQGADLLELYTVYNKCGYQINVRVVVQGQVLGCQPIRPYDYGVFQSYRASPDWIVQSC